MSASLAQTIHHNNHTYTTARSKTPSRSADGRAYFLTSVGVEFWVDEGDFSLVAPHRCRWKPTKSRRRKNRVAYPVVTMGSDTPQVARLVLGLKRGDKRQPHHINGDRRDNSRGNLLILSNEDHAKVTAAIEKVRKQMEVVS